MVEAGRIYYFHSPRTCRHDPQEGYRSFWGHCCVDHSAVEIIDGAPVPKTRPPPKNAFSEVGDDDCHFVDCHWLIPPVTMEEVVQW